MISPDTKDWTWVLERRCPECGYEAAAGSRDDLAGRVRENAAAWLALLGQGRIGPGLPDRQRWSSLEYAAHVRDVYRRFDERLAMMLEQDEPDFPNWDQDATAADDRYDEQDPAAVVGDLNEAAAKLASSISQVTGEQWLRQGCRGDGAVFTVESLLRYLVHDPVHHVWDVTAGPAARS